MQWSNVPERPTRHLVRAVIDTTMTAVQLRTSS
jgi:hypothetical protein